MHTFFDTVPSAAAQLQIDGHLYALTSHEMYGSTDGKRHVRPALAPRMMRVSHIARGVAYLELGKAGDAIACTENLPFSVVTFHDADQALGTRQ